MNTKSIHYLILSMLQKEIPRQQKLIVDYAILGSCSGHYGWKETRFCDFDLWIYCYDLNSPSTFAFIKNIIEKIRHATIEMFECEVKALAMNGPYKPDVWQINYRDELFLHLLLDDSNFLSQPFHFYAIELE